MTSDNPDGPCAFHDAWTITHPDHPLADDATAAIVDNATIELTLLRSPGLLGDGLADLHAMASLLAQLHTWIPMSITAAKNQGHSWAAIARQLQVTPACAKRRYRGLISADPSTGPD